MYFDIRRRGKDRKAVIVESGFKTREDAKPRRDELNIEFYGSADQVPEHNREYFVSRSHLHRHGPSK